MAAFNVSNIDLTDYGYPEDISFVDPMSSTFRAKPYSGTTDLDQIRQERLPWFASLNAYPDAVKVESALHDYWEEKTKSSSSTKSSTTGAATAPPAAGIITAAPSTFATVTTTSVKATTTTKAATTTADDKGGKGKGRKD